ncbi:MAG: hypothetical protein NVSMB6_01410 [Burkholderiaceae bacterium]
MKTVLLLILRAYQLCISPYLGQNCRFHPSCSDYAVEAIGGHGAMEGLMLVGKRLCKCHPWHAGGADPVPLARKMPAAPLPHLILQPFAAAAPPDLRNLD